MDVFPNFCENHKQNYRYICKEDRSPLCDKCLELETIHKSHDLKILKDQEDTYFASKGQSTEETKLKQKATEIKMKIKKSYQQLEAVSVLYQFLFEKKQRLEKQALNLENQINDLDKYLLDSKSSRRSFESFCQKKPNKYDTINNFKQVKDQDNTQDFLREDQNKIYTLMNEICIQLGFRLEKKRTYATQTSQRELMSPSHHTGFAKQLGSITSKSPKGNITFFNLQNSAKLSKNPLRLAKGSIKLTSSPKPTNILQRLRKQKEDFNQFKIKFGY